MFGKARGSAHEKHEQLPPAAQLQDSNSVSVAESASTEISCIGPGMTVVGKISSEGTLNVFGRVKGELYASIVRISDGAQVEGTIAAISQSFAATRRRCFLGLRASAPF